MSLIDVLDQNGESTGETIDKVEAHRQGIWHGCVWVWIHDETGRVLLQKRAPGPNRPYPGCWDIAAGGHMDAGDNQLEAATREVAEELGLIVQESQLQEIDSFPIDITVDMGKEVWAVREHISVYLLQVISTQAFTLQEEEVSEVRWFTADELKKELAENPMAFTPHDNHYDDMINLIQARTTQQ